MCLAWFKNSELIGLTFKGKNSGPSLKLVSLSAKISEYQMPNDQKSLNDQKMYVKQLGQLFSSKISHTILQ